MATQISVRLFVLLRGYCLKYVRLPKKICGYSKISMATPKYIRLLKNINGYSRIHMYGYPINTATQKIYMATRKYIYHYTATKKYVYNIYTATHCDLKFTNLFRSMVVRTS